MIKVKNIITVLDIGSTKISCFIFKRLFADSYEVIGVFDSVSKGIKSGMIINLEAARYSIMQAVEGAAKIASVDVKNVHISLNSSFLISERSSADISLSTEEVTVKELNKLLFKILSRFNKEATEVIHTIPYEYILDGNRGILHPLGLYGNKLTGLFHIISVPANYVINLNKCLELCKIKIEAYVSTGYAAGMSCLKSEEKEFGCGLIEIGGGSTTVSLFHNDKFIFTDGIPFGGIDITKDISKIFSIEMNVAEKIKNTQGLLIRKTTNDLYKEIKIELLDNQEYLINQKDLRDVMVARMEEILFLLKNKLEEDDIKNLANKIIFTGGGATLIGMKDLVEDVFGIKARIGIPNNCLGIPIDFVRSDFAVPVGMIRCISDMNNYRNVFLEDKRGILNSTWRWFKENF